MPGGPDAGQRSEQDVGFIDTGVDRDVGTGTDVGIGLDVDAGPVDAGMATEPPLALSTRSLTSHSRGSDPGRIEIVSDRLTIDLSPVQGATVYRATLDPYLDPRPQRLTRRLIVDGVALTLLPPRKLTFDATAAVRLALEQGLSTLVVDIENMEIESASLDILCDRPAVDLVPQATNPAVRHEQGDTMITFEEVDSPIVAAQSTFGQVRAARAANAPSGVDKTRYRIYRSLRPIDDFGDVIDAELIDEIQPLSGWGDEFAGFDIEENMDATPVGMLPVDDLTPALPGTGIYVRRHEGTTTNAYYLVSTARDGAESFDAMEPVGPVTESSGSGMALLTGQETYDGPWVFTSDIFMRLDFYARWSPVG
ncbi:MAG: hypothetical protein AAF449_15730, partial [Myxococcota bacterium]